MQVANSLQFGDLRCYVDHKVHLHNVTNDVCMDIKTQVRKILIFSSDRSSRNRMLMSVLLEVLFLQYG